MAVGTERTTEKGYLHTLWWWLERENPLAHVTQLNTGSPCHMSCQHLTSPCAHHHIQPLQCPTHEPQAHALCPSHVPHAPDAPCNHPGCALAPLTAWPLLNVLLPSQARLTHPSCTPAPALHLHLHHNPAAYPCLASVWMPCHHPSHPC